MNSYTSHASISYSACKICAVPYAFDWDLIHFDVTIESIFFQYCHCLPLFTIFTLIIIKNLQTDTSTERNALMTDVYPKLKAFCKRQGYEFQVWDLIFLCFEIYKLLSSFRLTTFFFSFTSKMVLKNC